MATSRTGSLLYTGLSLAAAWLALACSSAVTVGIEEPHTEPLPKRNIIVDTDMAVDDWPALLYVLNQRDKANVLGVTVEGTGEAHCVPGVENALRLIHLTGRAGEGIRVACGDSVPMEGVHTFPDAWRTDMDALFGIEIPEGPQTRRAEPHAAELLQELLTEATGQVDLITLGPLTNVAQAFERYGSAVAGKVGRIYMMGGALDVPGNVIVPGVTDALENRTAEWNLWVDPLAAQIVFRSGVPITMVGLDATNQVQVTREFAEAFKAAATSPAAKFADEVLDRNLDNGFIDSGEYFFWDPLAAAAAFEPICELKTVKVDVHIGEEAGVSAESQLEHFASTFAPGALVQFAGELDGRRSFDVRRAGDTFASSALEAKEIQVCTRILDPEHFMDNYMAVLNRS